jgi:putative oxidoreductase
MNSIALLLLRIVFCGSMIFGHGLGKLNKVLDGNFNFSDPIGIGEAPTLFLAVFSEFIAPIFILLGIKSRIFSFFPAATMFVAAFIIHLDDPFNRMEKSLLFLTVFVFFVMTGSGKYSLDRIKR